MEAEDDAGERDAECAEQQSGFERGIEEAEWYGDGESRHGVSGRKRESIGRQQRGPTMRLDFARSFSINDLFYSQEERERDRRRYQSRSYRSESSGAAKQQQKNSHRAPEPSVAGAGGQNHPDANPTGRPPAVQPPHQIMIARRDVTKHSARRSR